jgi:hypothetical protein
MADHPAPEFNDRGPPRMEAFDLTPGDPVVIDVELAQEVAQDRK